MGISSKKSTTSQQSTSTTAPNVPQWGVDSLTGLNNQIEGIAGTDPSKFVAPASDLQNQAFAGAGTLPSTWQPGNTQASELATKVGNSGPVSSADSISKFLNPYLKNVVDTSLADFDQNARETRARQHAQGAVADAFGGDRWGLQEGETEGQLARARGTLDSGLRSGAWTDAESQANNDANRGEQALQRQEGVAGLLGNLSNSANANSVADLTAQAGLGDTQRGIAQDTATAPISLAQTVAQLLGQNQLPLLTGQTTNSSGTGSRTDNPSTFEQVGAGIQTAANLAALFSDRRLKRDIVKLGVRPDGLGVYLFRYLWSPIRHVGVMAQEVLKVKPQAVIEHPSGFLMVDYGVL